MLNAGSKVAILIGGGAIGAADEVTQVAQLLSAGVAKALLGKAALPDDLPFVTGSIGLLGTEPSDWMMQHCDTLLMIGSRFPYSEFLPETGKARGVQIDLDPTMLSIRYPMEVALTGDAVQTLRQLIPLLKQQERPCLAQRDRAARDALVGGRREAFGPVRQPGQSGARLLGALVAPAGQRDHHG